MARPGPHGGAPRAQNGSLTQLLRWIMAKAKTCVKHRCAPCLVLTLRRIYPQGREERLCGYAPAAGVLTLGFLDTAASIVGTSIGRVPIHPGAKKTLEGLIGGAPLQGFHGVIGPRGMTYVEIGRHLRAAIFIPATGFPQRHHCGQKCVYKVVLRL